MQNDALDAWMMDRGRLPSYDSRGRVRGFRSRPGAPMATPSSGLSSGSRATKGERDDQWGEIFGSNSNLGSRPGAGGDPLGTTANPLRFSPAQTSAIAAGKGVALPFPNDSAPATPAFNDVSDDGLPVGGVWMTRRGTPAFDIETNPKYRGPGTSRGVVSFGPRRSKELASSLSW